jgi:hypothetical protein
MANQQCPVHNFRELMDWMVELSTKPIPAKKATKCLEGHCDYEPFLDAFEPVVICIKCRHRISL